MVLKPLGILILALMLSGPAQAGAWLREQGKLFTAATAVFRDAADNWLDESGFYVEYGASQRLTLGLHYHQPIQGSTRVLAFARIPLKPETGNTRLAVELGLGAHSLWGEWAPMYKVTLSYGVGFQLWDRSHWLNIDAAIEHPTGLGDPYYKLDLTAGQSTGGPVRPIFQIESTFVPGQRPFWAVTSGVMIDGWRPDQTWVVGIESRHVTEHSLGLKLAVWQRF